jgi:hypothetical protein
VSARPSVLLGREPHLYIFRLVINVIFAIELLVLLVLRLLVRIILVVWLIVLHKIAASIGGGVSVAKAHHPWMVVVRS